MNLFGEEEKKYIVLSASRMTDMPKYYPQELINAVNERIEKGQNIHTLVLWTKHPYALLSEPLRSFLNLLKGKGIQLYIQLTVTGMGGLAMGVSSNMRPLIMEPNVPTWQDSLSVLPAVIELIGTPLRIRFRLDPIIRFKDVTGMQYSNISIIPLIIEKTQEIGIKTYSFSFVEKGIHNKVDKRFKNLGIEVLPPSSIERSKTATWFQNLMDKYNINIYSCSVPELPVSSCIDGALLEKLHDQQIPLSKKEPRHRDLCCCTESIDIGGWPPRKCFSGCQYCYAHSSYGQVSK
jgi:hypothetical protein